MDINQVMTLHDNGLFLEAEKGYLMLLESQPDNAYLNNLLGLLYSQLQEYSLAEKYIKKAISLEDNVDYLENLAVCYYLQARYNLSMPILEQILEKVPRDLARIRDYAKMAKDVKCWEFAIKFYSMSLNLDKRDYVAMNNIGLGLEDLKQFEKAKGYYESSLKVKPNYCAYHNLGVYYRRARNFEKSVVYLKKALQLQPDNVDSMTSLGMSYLSMRDFENGYKYYQHRCPSLKARFQNPWDGKEHLDSTIVIYYDGGRGDQLMFCRYILFIQQKFKKVIFVVYDELKEFFKFNYPDLDVKTVNEAYTYDYSVNLMELHYFLKMDFNNIPFSKGYLKADEKKVEEYKNKFFNTEKLKVGLFWQGNLKVFPYRSMKLEEMSPLFDMENCQFYSYQKGAGIEQLEKYPQIVNLGDTFNDYSDTASALKNLDLLITIDTSILHLAGALGVKTFLLLPHASEWRWFHDEQTTPWYDSVRIFKQEKLYDWSIPIQDVINVL